MFKMSQEILSLKETEKWNKYICKLPVDQQDIYFTPEYYQLHEKYGDGKTQCFVFELDGEIALYPFFINPINKKVYKLDDDYFDIQGAYGYNGVVSSSYDAGFIDAFFKTFAEYCAENNIIAEFTRFHPILKNYRFSEKNLTISLNRQTVKLDLTKPNDEIWSDYYSKSNRNKIRKAEKSNVIISVSDLEEDYKAFYNIYAQTMKGVSAGSYYYFGYEYFNNFNNFIGKNQKLMIARYDDKIVSALFLMIKGDYAHIHLSGSIYEYLKFGVNNKIKHEAALLSKELGAKYLNFGGGNSADLNDPLFKFKANFSTERGDFYIGKKIHNNDTYEKVCDIWASKYPEKKEKYANFFLKYKELDDE
ncbi:MAG: hypothetical protein B6I20_01130 [Bacteroidetes bacterium 4572_117]|nr:MAG: hypothetical protein B6I20_01130 [Bacteroidetes bacterium 4572_117]